jgi:hypothetical protein
MQPGMSMAAVAHHGINVDLLRRWARDVEMAAELRACSRWRHTSSTGHDPWVHLKDVLQQHPNQRIDELLAAVQIRENLAADTMPVHETHRNTDR